MDPDDQRHAPKGRPPRAALLALALAAAALSACGADERPNRSAAAASGAYVTRIAGTDAFVALISDGRGLTGYVCDGRRVSQWLRTTPVNPARGPAGLYRATIERHDRRRADAGWIVLADGSQRGKVNQFMESDIEVITKPAPALDPFRATVAIRDGTSNT